MTKQSVQMSGAGAAAVFGAPMAEKNDTIEEQAKAIICMAKRAVEEAATKAKIRGDGDGAAAAGEPSSLKRSLQCFLEGRNKKATTSSAASRRRLGSSPAAAASSSSSN